ncbi:ISL3 family transposase (plasmid) [Roseibium aggregatum]|uniref:ISL3 family transposase n=1 Tax=Roseibium aggregatum TaxID=187304 RepID=UPI001E44197B|nr:ISL3 family transposase [Roseibium aggregatum]UES60012.1 ISL3 family transposase [Roseibium aggregatum]UES60136.1 ISL3 family transposase [Roseibium aggregatum]
MRHRIPRASLAPDGFSVDEVKVAEDSVQIQLRSRQPLGRCPDCGRVSRRVQSRYVRRPADLPLSGRRVQLTIVARRFWCDAVLCGRRIFCEQFDVGVLARYGRRTQRLETIVHHLGLALGGRPAAAFANRLMMPVSNDTLLRVVRRRIADHSDELTVIGIDDFAFRRGQTYGTIVCDLERRRPVTLLPDRTLDTSRSWLAQHQSISIVARDRGGGYGEAIAKALPDAEQVADRWHLMENSSRAFLDAVGRSMRQIRQAVGSNVVDPKLLTYAEKLQYEGYLRRQETNEAIRELSKMGTPIRQIVRQTGHSRKLVRDVLRGQRLDVFRTRPSSLDSWLPWLNSRWDEGARNALALWREMREKGFSGQSGVVSQWAQRRRLAEKANQSGLARTPSARVIARLMTAARNDLAKSEAVLVAAIEMSVPDLVAARDAIGDFQSMIRSKTACRLDDWLETAKNSLVGSFANGVEKDIDAVRNAIISPWSNGQTEGQITRLKLIKRQMYGRAKLDLLQARLIGAS